MTEYDNTNTGVLFKNDNPGERRPDYTGKINLDGVEKDLAAWLKVSQKTGKTFMSLKISEKWVNPNQPTQQAPQQAPQQNEALENELMPDDDIPW